MIPKRRKTRAVRIGGLKIGGGAGISVQSMTNTDTRDFRKTIAQIRELEEVGCEIIRVAVPDMEAALVLGKIKKAISAPLVADIHFDWRLALEAVRQGVDKIRINPGNIGEKEKVREVVWACKAAGVPIRIGVNSGSLKVLKNNPRPRWTAQVWAQTMVKEALEEVEILEGLGFRDILVSLKADDIERTLLANRLFAKKTDIPLHLGVTEAGTFISGIAKSAIGIGSLLSGGIGDTIRVSLTEEPKTQVRVAYEILKSLKLREYGPDLISCPTCGRCQADVVGAVHEIEERIYSDRELIKKAQGFKIAVMGCVVNGPGEAREADFGICGGKGKGVWIEKGRQTRVLKQNEWSNEVIRKIRNR
ncbi:MAG: 4-hydroxy-3-methylbut-2-en-1-yl diphosphate synthase [Elusimicrobia bacterium CG08_land_8_20_14_0_20_51_18]|nr:MAG: 4-hydroxy-3-methylbut-2-en-1-yl diphosphate synthase [Elusimicrobia bacterium CG08_land_8_20_14_0_20_51_18]